ncbi:MAG: hypothetical protein II988_02325 [Clostridia bacterium]|nr:hypothetical protein [Clostridia bacterium]
MNEKTRKKQIDQTDYLDALKKKALGYDATEVVEEYSQTQEGEVTLTKRKVTKKNVPPDITALKILLEQEQTPISQMSDEQLEQEKQRLLELLGQSQTEKENKNCKRKQKTQNPLAS